MCHFVREEVFRGAFEKAMHWCAYAVIEAAYCLLVHGRLCNVRRKLLHRMCAYMQDEAHVRVKHCVGLGS